MQSKKLQPTTPPHEEQQGIVYRDIKTGRKIDIEEELSKEKTQQHKAPWSTGLKQKHDAERRLQELENIRTEPFARHKSDQKLNQELKTKIRWDDPMREHFLSSTSSPTPVPSVQSRRGPPNRYDIPPGPQWDGVDRSNGFEQRLLAKRSDAAAMKHAAYKWRSEDM